MRFSRLKFSIFPPGKKNATTITLLTTHIACQTREREGIKRQKVNLHEIGRTIVLLSLSQWRKCAQAFNPNFTIHTYLWSWFQVKELGDAIWTMWAVMGSTLKASLFVPWGEIVMMSNAAANSLRKETEASNTDTLIHCARTWLYPSIISHR